MITVSITQNGVLDLDAGAFQLARLYPALDGVPLHAVKVEVDPMKLSVLWHLEGNRRFRLNISREKDCLRIAPRLEGFPTAPHSVSLFHQSVVKGAQRIWCPAEGMGCGGDTPDFPLAKAKRASGCCALFSDDGQTLGLWVEDQSRFLAQANGLANHLSWVYRTENVPLESGELELPSLRLALGDDPWVLLTRMVGAMGQAAAVQPRPHRRTWCSWYYYYHHFCRRDLQGVLDGLLSLPDRGGIQEDDSFCAFRMESVPEACRYWVLYEGTPGGSETPEEVEFLLPDGAWTPAAAPWTGPLPAAAWIAFRSIRSPRAILLAAPPGLPVLSSSWWMDSMTVCGLGRDPGDIRNKAYAAPGTFLLGLAESQDPELLATRAEAWRALEGAKDD